MNKIINHPTIIPLLTITLIAIIAQAVFIPFLGFYSDDFFFGYIGHFFGPEGIIKSLIIDRPFNGYLLGYIYRLFGDYIIYWHIGIFTVRLLSGYILFFLLRKIWPNNIFVTTSITLLALIYPGFLQQSLPLGYLTWFIPYTLGVISLALSVYAIKTGSKFKLILFTLISIAAQTTSFLLLEFLVGLEILRFLLINYSLNRQKRSIKTRLLHWLPYLTTAAVFTLWRIFIFKSTRDITNVSWVIQNYYSNNNWVTRIPIEIASGFFHTVILAYILPLIVNIFRVSPKNTLVSLFLGVFSAAIILWYLRRVAAPAVKKDASAKPDRKLGRGLILTGCICVLGALAPIIASGRMVREYLVYDRYTITSMIGVGFILTGFLLHIFLIKKRELALSVLVFLGVFSQSMNSCYRIANWKQQKDIWWQLYWRSPKIKDDAFLIFEFPKLTKNNPFSKVVNHLKWNQIYWVDYQIWAPGNLFFNYTDPPDKHFRGELLSNAKVLQNIKNKTHETIIDRNLEYQKNYAHVVIISTANDTSCLWVYDKYRRELSQNSDEAIKEILLYSDPQNLVQKDGQSFPPQFIFGKEPQKNWCYFFQRASYLRQVQKWKDLSELTNEVLKSQYRPGDINEWFPFIEGMIINQKYSEVNKLIKDILSEGIPPEIFITNICNMTKRLKTSKVDIKC